MANSPADLELMLTELCTSLIKHSNGKLLWLSAAQRGIIGNYICKMTAIVSTFSLVMA